MVMNEAKISSVKRVTYFMRKQRSKPASRMVRAAHHMPCHQRPARNGMPICLHRFQVTMVYAYSGPVMPTIEMGWPEKKA